MKWIGVVVVVVSVTTSEALVNLKKRLGQQQEEDRRELFMAVGKLRAKAPPGKGLHVRGGAFRWAPVRWDPEMDRAVARKTMAALLVVYAAACAITPSWFCELMMLRNDVETRSRLRCVGVALGQMVYLLGLAKSTTDIVAANVLVYLIYATHVLFRLPGLRSFGLIAGQRVDGAILLAMVAGGLLVLTSSLDAKLHLKAACYLGVAYASFVLFAAAPNLRDDNLKIDADSIYLVRLFAGYVLGSAVTSHFADHGAPVSVAAFRGLQVGLLIDVPFSSYRLIAAYTKKLITQPRYLISCAFIGFKLGSLILTIRSSNIPKWVLLILLLFNFLVALSGDE